MKLFHAQELYIMHHPYQLYYTSLNIPNIIKPASKCVNTITPIVFKKKLPQLPPFLLHHCCVEMPNVSLGKVVIQNEDRHFRQTRLAPGTRVLRLCRRSYRDQIGNVMFICIEKTNA